VFFREELLEKGKVVQKRIAEKNSVRFCIEEQTEATNKQICGGHPRHDSHHLLSFEAFAIPLPPHPT
jgi:hypothetical protein